MLHSFYHPSCADSIGNIKPPFHWSKNPLTPFNIWLLSAVGMDSNGRQSRVKWLCSGHRFLSAPAPIGSDGNETLVTAKQWGRQVSQFLVRLWRWTWCTGGKNKGKLLYWQWERWLLVLFRQVYPHLKNLRMNANFVVKHELVYWNRKMYL